MPFGIAAAAVGAAGAIGGAAMSASAAKKGAKSAANTEREKLEQQREIFDIQRGDQMPYMDAGKLGLQATADLSGANGLEAARAAQANFLESPGYQFQLEQGQRAIDRSAAARGMLRSGATMEASQRFGQGLAAQDFNSYYNRLSDLAKSGQAAASGVAQSANVLSNAIGQTGSNIAQTQASLGAAQASIYGNAASNVGNAINSGLQNYAYGQRRNELTGYGSGSGGIWDGQYGSSWTGENPTTGF